ncbi:uncharacterized protein EAF02_010100 [Botrytis sinoallii]|uniref:uncharacterized protein n=1 Tax=Botrytis sinoallii TaxID=1463999 RepID=UPI001900BADB|nr:uncharacterized protein EAF02_010100 [Botrytis sinoallii]KAF7864132.1 hypothetical protein EAF02_010100 [Botrytis sinoallii]
MPRLSHALLRRAYNISPLLPLVLRETRSLSSAINELRWLREYVDKTMSHRQKTEAYTTYLAELLIKAKRSFHETSENQQNPLKIIDFCSGTGCISLLLYSLLNKVYPRLEIVGLDISKKALDLSIQNVRFNALNRSAQQSVRFEFADVLEDEERILDIFQGVCDVIVSNPPYISEDGFDKETTRSVRNWEPKLALVPDASRRETIHFNGDSGNSSLFEVEDIFYHRLLRFHSLLKSKILVMEIGDEAQAKRVAQMAIGFSDRIEIWRDWPDQREFENESAECMFLDNHKIVVKGTGMVRAVVLLSNQHFEL